jgi:signal transduction histidine kinase
MSEAREIVASAIEIAQANLERALSALEDMPASDAGSIAFAAHALNNYLTVTAGVIELLSVHLIDHPDAQIGVWLKGMQHATELMGRTVSHLMNASATPETELRSEQVDLSRLVRRVCDYYRRVAARKAIRVLFDPPVDVPPVCADAVAIAAVLDNLLSNAVKYSQPGKEVRVQIRGEEDRVVSEVRDEGPGLSEEDQTRLFQRGVRLTPRPTGGESSMGYGLAVARDLVEKMGGTISCESVLGQGACFSFSLPVYRELPRHV